MEKLVYLLNNKTKTPERFTELALENLADKLKRCGAYRVAINVADLNEAVQSAAPGRIFGTAWQSLDAVVSFWLDNLDQRRKIELLLSACCEHFDGYLVTESIVQNFAREWPPKTRRPGVTQFTALAKPAAVSEEDFYHNWQIKHSASSFDLHPRRWSYVRNAIARPLTAAAPAYRALVLEHFRELEDFTDDSRYFGT
ncbi:MAG TPA: hypothetical protein VLC91_12450, partial [Spongiibacteraceae bacterium]|nr:hypothetical protein [Spongiibacteraceae bacterium]